VNAVLVVARCLPFAGEDAVDKISRRRAVVGSFPNAAAVELLVCRFLGTDGVRRGTFSSGDDDLADAHRDFDEVVLVKEAPNCGIEVSSLVGIWLGFDAKRSDGRHYVLNGVV